MRETDVRMSPGGDSGDAGPTRPERAAPSVAGPISPGTLALLLLACLVGLLLRISDLGDMYAPDGGIILGRDDSFFHARRALYIFENFPEVLEFDRYLAYPRGAAQPSPPLHDWLIAGTARLFGDDLRTFELVAAWISPVLGALFALSAFWIARSLAGAGVGLLASWLVTVMPAGALLTSIGNCDHHATVALLASFWLAASLREPRLSGHRLAWHTLLHASIVTALMLTWSGSLLYVVIGEGSRLATVLIFRSRPERFFAAAGSQVIAAGCVCWWLLSSAPPLGGPLTSQMLSWLHAILLVSLAVLSLWLGILERFRPVASVPIRLGRAALIGLCLALPSLALPEVRESLATGLSFLGKQDAWAKDNIEQMGLFEVHEAIGARGPTVRFGYFVYTAPLLPLFVAYLGIRAREEERAKWLLLLLWTLSLCVLALSQIRYATDFSVLAAVGFALIVNELRIWLARGLGPRLALPCVAVFVLVMISPAYFHFMPQIARTAQHLMADKGNDPNQPLPWLQALYKFAQMTRHATPETAGFLDATQIPEYGLLTEPDYGHLFTYVARRPMPSNNLGPYLDPELYRLATLFYRVRRAHAALKLLEAMQVRYFITSAERLQPDSFAAILHRSNDSSQIAGAHHTTGRIRLVAAGPPGGKPFKFVGSRGRRGTIPPNKLFEIVEGAVLVGETEPNALANAELQLRTPLGRIRYGASARADASGKVRLRVPYPSETPNSHQLLVCALGKWKVVLGNAQYEVDVSEEDVREGRTVPLGDPLP